MPENMRRFKFHSIGKDVRRGPEHIATAATISLARRIVTALNYHQPVYDRERGYTPLPRTTETKD